MRRYTLAASILFHGLAVAAIIIAPMFAGVALPEPHRPISFLEITPVEVVAPDIPQPRAQPSDSPSPMAAPITAPAAITREVPVDPPPDPASGGSTGAPTLFSFGGDAGRGADIAPPPAPRREPEPRRVGGIIQTPSKIHHVLPSYPEIARNAKIEGVVILEAVISASGHVDRVRVLRSVRLLDESAIAAVRQWRFTPTMLNGEAIPVVMTVTVTFQLAR
jgi:protein TonB